MKIDANNPIIIRTYRLFRNRVTREIKKAKKEYYKTYFENNLSNIRKTWKGIKEIINLNNKQGEQVNQLRQNNKIIDNDEEISNTFNKFFTNVGPQLDNDIPQFKTPNGHHKFLKNRNINTFLVSPTSPTEITELINGLDESKSSGPCSIPIKLLKICKTRIAIPLSDICNSSFIEGIFPTKSKIAKVIPCFKSGSREDVNNYRPISLLSILVKLWKNSWHLDSQPFLS